MNLHALLAWIKYRRHALTRHGVHSPFVFDFMGKVLRSRHATFQQRLADYLGEDNLVWAANTDPRAWQHFCNSHVPAAADDQVLVFAGIHRTPQHSRIWQELSARPEVRLSIDLYRYGLLFFKKEFREKQHFVLR